MDLWKRFVRPSEEDHAEDLGRRALEIVTEPGKPRAHELPWLQRTRQELLSDVAAETRQPRDWPMGGDVHA